LINAIICDVLTGFINSFQERDGKRLLMEALSGFLILLTLWCYGEMRINEVHQLLSRAPSLNVSLIQGNIDQSVKWDPKYQDATLDIYKTLSELSSSSSSGLVIWPETAAPFYFQDYGRRSREVILLAKDSAKWLLFGSPSYVQERKQLSYYNSAFLISPEGAIAGRYDKVHLVPYGEYVPLRRLFPYMSKIVAGVGDFGTGKGYYPLSMGNRRIGVLICYEAIFPEASRTYKREGADILVNITNDAWFGRSSAPYQHLSMTVFRAVETRLYVARAANTGISALIDPTGKILSHTPLFVRTALKEKVRFVDKGTYYMAYGDAFVYLCLLSLLCILVNSFLRRKKCLKN
jgi:apolipoprotein N-acyltransferase